MAWRDSVQKKEDSVRDIGYGNYLERNVSMGVMAAEIEDGDGKIWFCMYLRHGQDS